MSKSFPLYIAGEWESSPETLEVVNPYDGSSIGITYVATPEQIERAIAAAQDAFQTTERMASYERAEILERIRQGLAARKEELARTIALEAGKPLKDALAEVERALLTTETAVEETKRITGEVLPLDLRAHSKGRMGFARRYPIGPIAAITPFNFPLNLPLHKLCPALAAGDTIVLKPAPKTPLTMLIVAEVLHQAGVPAGAVSVLVMSDQMAEEKLVRDDRFKMLSFTGSAAVGWMLKARAGKKRVILELGGNAGVVVDKGSNLDYAVDRIARGGFGYAGQSCISAQRIYIHLEVFETFTQRLVEATLRLKMGDPLDPKTDLGPMINQGAVQRSQEWVDEAVAEGAVVIAGGKAQGRFFPPTILANVPPTCKVCSMEVFAPIVVLTPFHHFEEAIAQVNDSQYGLQAGVFTPSLENAFYAFDHLRVGGVIINDAPNYRIDPMPYGGVKDSGSGREGIRYAIEEMTELHLMVLNRI